MGSDSVRVRARHIGPDLRSSPPCSWAMILLSFLNCHIYTYFFIFSPTLLPMSMLFFFFFAKLLSSLIFSLLYNRCTEEKMLISFSIVQSRVIPYEHRFVQSRRFMDFSVCPGTLSDPCFCFFIDCLALVVFQLLRLLDKSFPYLWCTLLWSNTGFQDLCEPWSKKVRQTLPFCRDSSDLGTATCCLGPEMQPWPLLESVWKRNKTCKVVKWGSWASDGHWLIRNLQNL